MNIIKKRLKWWLFLASIIGFFFTVSYFVDIIAGDDSTFNIVIMCIWAVMTIIWCGMCIRTFRLEMTDE